MSYFLLSLPLPDPQSVSDIFSSPSADRSFYSESLDRINNAKIDKLFQLLQAEFLNAAQGACTIFNRWDIPTFKTRTLDSLLSLSDDLAQLDLLFEATLKRQAQQFLQLTTCGSIDIGSPISSFSPSSPFSIAIEGIEELVDSPGTFLENFSWNHVKYNSDSRLSELILLFSSEIQQLDASVKTALVNYQTTLAQLSSLRKREQGSLAIRPLKHILPDLQPDLADSEFISRIILVVPITEEENFLSQYEQYSPLVVPRSALLILKDSEYSLYSVLVFKKFVNEFKAKAHKSRIVIREPEIEHRQDMDSGSEEKIVHRLAHEKLETIALIQSSFTEAYAIYLHFKTVRLFVESVLKYGLPPIYGVFLLKISSTFPKKHLNEKFWIKHVNNAVKGELNLEEIQTTGHYKDSYSKDLPEDPLFVPGLSFIVYPISASFAPNK